MPTQTIIGNAVRDPELNFVKGVAVCDITIASTPRKFDRDSNKWVDDGEAVFMRGSVWRQQAENLANSVSKGDKVIMVGELISRSWDDKETGQKRTVIEMKISDIGPSLQWNAVTVEHTEKKESPYG